MAITINGSGPVAGVTTLGMTSGTITGLSAGGLPDATITQPDLAAGVAGNGPAFSAYQNSGQTVSNNTWTKVQFQAKEFDTNNNFDSTTNYRFTPTVAGYYLFTAVVTLGGISTASTQNATVALYKNGGASTKNGSTTKFSDSTSNPVTVSGLFYMNGSTDYVEVYFLQITNASQTLSAGSGPCSFQGFLARAA